MPWLVSLEVTPLFREAEETWGDNPGQKQELINKHNNETVHGEESKVLRNDWV